MGVGMEMAWHPRASTRGSFGGLEGEKAGLGLWGRLKGILEVEVCLFLFFMYCIHCVQF